MHYLPALSGQKLHSAQLTSVSHGGGQPGHRIRADFDVAALPPHHDQHGAQHDAAKHGGGGAHHQPCHDLNLETNKLKHNSSSLTQS